jgi:predicted regulator of Ras-like GTPase activity (Roadblock/LC7/MglB family)
MTMTSDTTPTPAAEPANPSWLLEGLAKRVPGIRSVLLLTSDGLKVAAAGLEVSAADGSSAMAASMFGCASTMGHALGIDPAVCQVMVEYKGHMLFMCKAGDRSVLAVLAERNSNAGLIGHEMTLLVRRVREELETPARPSGGPTGLS